MENEGGGGELLAGNPLTLPVPFHLHKITKL